MHAFDHLIIYECKICGQKTLQLTGKTSTGVDGSSRVFAKCNNKICNCEYTLPSGYLKA